MTARAALYLRVSDPSQEGNYSLGTQETDGRAHCAERGYEVVEVYREVFTGVYLDARPELTRLRRSVEQREVDVVVVWHPDRLSREQDDRVYLRVEAKRRGVRYEFVNGARGDSEEERLVEYIQGYAAKHEWRRNRERSIANVRARVDSGKLIPGGWPLYGYRWRDPEHKAKTGYVEDPGTSCVVRRIFAEAAAGRPVRAIARGLTADGVPTPRNARMWYPKRVWDTIRHPAYKGEGYAYVNRFEKRDDGTTKQSRRTPDEWVPLPEGTVPPLVDEATWDRANARLANNRASANRPGYDATDALLRAGHVLCGYCGRRMYVKRLADGPYYTCQTANRRPEGGCRYHSIKAPELDAAVWARVQWVLTDPGVVQIEHGKRRQADHAAEEARGIERQLRDIERQEANVTDAVARRTEGPALDTLLAKLDDLGRRRTALRERLAEIEAEHARLARDGAALRGWLDHLLRSVCDVHGLDYEGRRERLARLGVSASVNRRDSGRPRYEILRALPYPDEAFGGDPAPWNRERRPVRIRRVGPDRAGFP